MEVRIAQGEETVDANLGDQIIEFDRRNMESVLKKAGIDFPEEKRREGFRNNPTFIITTDGSAIVGYLEYCRSWDNPNYIYISSVQIDKRYRNSRLILLLIDKFRSLVLEESFIGIMTSVQKSNSLAVKMYKKIGFVLEENPNNNASLLAKAGKEILEDSPIIPTINRWRKKL